jgi:hypothetical protein
MTIMTVDEVQTYLANHPQGNAAEWRHMIDPLDYDGCPFQGLAPGAAEALDTVAPQKP